jgi:hypothetical protein
LRGNLPKRERCRRPWARRSQQGTVGDGRAGVAQTIPGTEVRRRSKLEPWAWILLAAFVAIAFKAHISSLTADPRVSFLDSDKDAEWIRRDEPFRLTSRRARVLKTSFRKSVEIRQPPSRALLVVRAFKLAAILVDGHCVLEASSSLQDWKQEKSVDITGFLAPGAHQIRIDVGNENGPPALLAFSREVGLRTGADWEASKDGESWAPARLAGAPWRTDITLQFPTAGQALLQKLPFYLPLFLAISLLSFHWPRLRGRWTRLQELFGAPHRVRWMLLWAWALLAANNLLKVPDLHGFDTQQHLSYISYIAEYRRIPLAPEGWEMFQSPLYYILCAPFYYLYAHVLQLGPHTVLRLLRLMSLLCGLGQVELCYRALRRVFPARPDLQVAGTAVGGFLPMILYLSHGLGNEPLSGLLSGAAIVTALALLDMRSWEDSRRQVLRVGFLLGLALLTKVTAVLLLLPMIFFMVWSLRAHGHGARRTAVAVVLFLSAATLVSGWYYARNWVTLGQPFLGGWDSARSIVWWQDPGYRTPEQLFGFGEALLHPIYAGTVSFLDAIYSTLWADGYLSSKVVFTVRPPWNYGFMLSGVLLALLPTGLMLLGAIRWPADRSMQRRQAFSFAAICMGLHLLALLHWFLVVPVYCIAKASYTAGITVCYAMLAAGGLELLGRNRLVVAILHGLLACFGASAYLAYFVI